jgi:hypothetical protein
MCTFEENTSKKFKSEVHIIDLKCTREDEEYSWGLKVHNKIFLGFLKIRYERIRSMMLQSALF